MIKLLPFYRSDLPVQLLLPKLLLRVIPKNLPGELLGVTIYLYNTVVSEYSDGPVSYAVEVEVD